MSSIVLFLSVVSLSFSTQIQAFSFRPNVVVSSTKHFQPLQMNAWGLQKLGQSVIDTAAPTIQDTDEVSIFRRAPVGAGTDDRSSVLDLNDLETNALLSKIDRSFQQQALLMSLQSSALSIGNKLERVELASSVQSLLPSNLSLRAISTASLKSGGLLNDWMN